MAVQHQPGARGHALPHARRRDEAFKKVEPIIKLMSVNRRFCGPTGQAAEVKALVNMVMNINTAGLAEGLGLAAALGLDLDMIREVFSQTGANSRVLETDGADMQAREHDCWFSAEHAAKDSGIALALAQKSLNLPLAAATAAQYEKMTAEGLGGLDKSGIAELTFPGPPHPQVAGSGVSPRQGLWVMIPAPGPVAHAPRVGGPRPPCGQRQGSSCARMAASATSLRATSPAGSTPPPAPGQRSRSRRRRAWRRACRV